MKKLPENNDTGSAATIFCCPEVKFWNVGGCSGIFCCCFATILPGLRLTGKWFSDEDTQRNPNSRFRDFRSEHRRIICKICYLYAADGNDFDDLYQEVLINLWQGLRGFEGRAKVSSWVYRVGFNTCISHYRRNRPYREVLPLCVCAEYAYDDPKDERMQQLHTLINRLDALEKAIVTLWLDEFSYEEIGDVTGLTRNNVASKLHRIKQKLREQANR